MSKWIPCSEAVPATEDKVLCQTITKKGVVNFVIGYYTEKIRMGLWDEQQRGCMDAAPRAV